VNQVSLTDLTAEVAVGARRTEVIVKLREAEGPLSVAQVAEQTGLHINTARFHLDGLVSDGLATRTVQERETAGRPRVLYASRAVASGSRSFGLLAEMLTGLVAALDGAASTALDVGRTWGRRLVEQPVSEQQTNADEALARLNEVLGAIGFKPEVTALRDGKLEVHLHHCPFQEVAERHTEVVCALHLGLMQGALIDLGAPLEAESLKPFVKPDLCVATLRAVPAGVA